MPLICVVGPTAVGKTALAVALAQRFGGEIISADSRQVYRGMTIGTAKPTSTELAAAPHHLVDIIDLSESFGVGLFLEAASQAMREIRERGKLPIVCGGTGQYVWALAEGKGIPPVPPNPDFRAELQAEAALLGADALHLRLANIDPVRAAALDSRNVRRVIRALEIHRATGQRPSEMLPAKAETPPVLMLGLTMPRDVLYRRIDRRVDEMMQAGFLREVEELAARYPAGLDPLASPGYRELGQHLAGELSLDEAIERTKTQTHRLARRQYAWFKLSDPRIHWLDGTDSVVSERAAEAVSEFLSGPPPCDTMSQISRE